MEDTYVHPDFNPKTNKYKGVQIDYIKHPRDSYVDHVELECEDRFKTSPRSGNEWRFNYRAKIYKKGVLITTLNGRSFSDLGSLTQFALQDISKMDTLAKDIDDSYFKFNNDMFKDYCCHPTCKEKGTRIYMLKTRYCHGGAIEYENNDLSSISIYTRKFCEQHGDRGDCGFDDSNLNYTSLMGKSPGCDAKTPANKISESGLVIIGM